MIDVMETVAFPDVDPDQPLGWDSRKNRGTSASLSKDGATSGGGSSLIRRFLPGFQSTTGVDLSDINVAVCVNQSGGELTELVNHVARRVGAAAIPSTYDLFD